MKNKEYKKEIQEIQASEDLIKNTINNINKANSKKSFQKVKKIALGAVAMMMISVTTYAFASGWVSSFIEQKFNNGGDDEFTYRIPQIDIKSEDSAKMNENIKEKYEKFYEEAVANFENDTDVVDEVDYQAYSNGDVLSVVAHRQVYGWISYSTYNINTSTGKKVENKELLEMKKLTEDDIEKEVILYMTEKAKNASYEDMTEAEIEEIQEDLLEKVNSMDINENTQFYLNNENHLCVVVTEYVMAGAGEYERLYDLEEHELVEEQYN